MQPIEIDQLIPHRDRMKLIDRIVQVNDDIAVASSVVAETWPLCTGLSVNAVVLIEVVAQTAGVLSSWKKGENRPSYKIGWLTGIKSAEFFVDEVPLNAELITTATTMYSFEDYEALEGSVMMGTSLLCKVQLQILSIKETRNFISID